MGLLFLEKENRYCVYNFKKNKIIEKLFAGETVKVLIDNKLVFDVIGYKNKNWCLEKSGYIGQDLNGLDLVEEKTFLGVLKSIIKNLFK